MNQHKFRDNLVKCMPAHIVPVGVMSRLVGCIEKGQVLLKAAKTLIVCHKRGPCSFN